MDREKVIKKAERIMCSTVDRDMIDSFCEDVIAMLEEQEAVEPKNVKGYNPPIYTLYEYECEECKSPMMSKQPFCMGCGRKVKWR